ncbi:hypothetical protein, partial [Pseudomonas syringae group genomosp. 7]|uniref:hypothetical protein n=1 Tax=Pseudomonas syringae group genomosp. 7 TaxID=251699 RepID=UPI00377048EB
MSVGMWVCWVCVVGCWVGCWVLVLVFGCFVWVFFWVGPAAAVVGGARGGPSARPPRHSTIRTQRVT